MVSLFAAAQRGQLEEVMRAERMVIRRASLSAAKRATRDLQLDVRAEVQRGFSDSVGGSAKRVANAIRQKLFDDRDRGATGIVFSRFGRTGPNGEFVDYLLPFTRGAELTPRSSKFLYISLERGTRNRRRRRIPVRQTKNVSFVPGKRGKVFVVRQTRTRSTLIAMLVPRVRLRKRFDFARPAVRAEQQFPKKLLDAFEEAER